MKIFSILILVVSNYVWACPKDKIDPLIYVEKWGQKADAGITIFSQKEYKSRSVNSLEMVLNFNENSSASVPVDITKIPHTRELKIDLSKFNASYIYITDDLIEKSEIIVTYDFEYEEGDAVLSCGSLSKVYKLRDLVQLNSK